MREALRIFRKDVRHLWLRLVPVLVLTALRGWVECQLFPARPIIDTVAALWSLSWLYLGACLIHEERLPGHTQYWLTRPYDWGHLLLAKALFLAVFAALPEFLAQAVSLVANGVPPLKYLPGLLLTTLIFAGGTCLIGAALASVTENLVQFLWAILPIAGFLIMGLALAGGPDTRSWGDVEWVRSSVLGAVILTAVAILLLQYSRRKTVVSRWVLAGGTLITVAVPFSCDWHAAWAIDSKLSARRIEDSAFHLAFDPASRPPSRFGDGSDTPKQLDAGVALPILITAVPAGTEAFSERIIATIDAPGGRSWSSGWTRWGSVVDNQEGEGSGMINADGIYWQYLNVNRIFYDAVKDTPVRVHTGVALTLLAGRKITPVASRGRSSHLAGDGICNVGDGPFATVMVSCSWPSRTPARSYVRARSLRTGQSLESLLTIGSGSPYSLDGSIWAPDSTLFSSPPAPLEMQLETWQAVAHFARNLDIPQVRLRDYAVRRFTYQ